jgi:hypothetical protein
MALISYISCFLAGFTVGGLCGLIIVCEGAS